MATAQTNIHLIYLQALNKVGSMLTIMRQLLNK